MLDSKIIVLNKFSPVEAKVSFLVESIPQMTIEESALDEKNIKFLHELKQTEINF